MVTVAPAHASLHNGRSSESGGVPAFDSWVRDWSVAPPMRLIPFSGSGTRGCAAGLLAEALRVWVRLGPRIGIAFLAAILPALLAFWGSALLAVESLRTGRVTLLIASLLVVVPRQLAVGASVLTVAQYRAKAAVVPLQNLGAAARRLWALFCVWVLVGVVVILSSIGLSLLLGLAPYLAGASTDAVWYGAYLDLVVLGSVTLSAAWATSRCWPAPAICVLETRSAISSIRRARCLTRRIRGPMLVGALVACGVRLVVYLLTVGPFGSPAPNGDSGWGLSGGPVRNASLYAGVTFLALDALIVWPLIAVVSAISYLRLMRRSAGGPSDELLRVFD